MPTGINGYGAGLYLTNSSDVLTKVLGLRSVNRPNLTVETADTTTHDSPNAVREFIAMLGDPGELSATIHYEPGSATDDLINEHLLSREKRPFKIVTVGVGGATEDNEGDVILTGYEPGDIAPDGVMEATVTGKVSGLMTQAAS